MSATSATLVALTIRRKERAMLAVNSSIINHEAVDAGRVNHRNSRCGHTTTFTAIMNCRNTAHNDPIVHSEERHPDGNIIVNFCVTCDGMVSN